MCPQFLKEWILMQILGFLWTLVIADFWKNTKTQIKLKPVLKKRIKKIADTFVENAMVFTSAKIQRKVLMFGEVRAPESSSWD